MPKYDLAGNPLPELGGSPAPPPGQGMPRPAAPPSYGSPPPYAPPSSDAPVRYDLAGNALPASAPPPPPAGGYAGMPTPGGSRPQATQPGVWPPPPTGGYGPTAPQERNDSGEKAGVPPEIAAFKWNWGAFWFTWLWCLNHRMVAWGVGIFLIGFVARLIPGGILVPIGISICFGVMGHKLGWQHRHFPGGVSQFIEVQRAWMRWAVGLFVATFLIAILAALLFPIFARARMQARMRANGGYTQPYNAPSNGSPGGGPGGP